MIVLTRAALLSRGAALWRNAHFQYRSNLQTAICIRHPHIVQIASGAMGGSSKICEFFHGRSSGFLHSVKWLLLILAFFTPIILLSIGLQTGQALTLLSAFPVRYIGVLAERCVFFAQPRYL